MHALQQRGNHDARELEARKMNTGVAEQNYKKDSKIEFKQKSPLKTHMWRPQSGFEPETVIFIWRAFFGLVIQIIHHRPHLPLCQTNC